MIQRVLTEPDWTQRMLPDDLRALMPLIYAPVTPLRDFSARHELDVADSVVVLFAAEQCQDNGIDLSGWKMLIGGGALPQALAREALELGLDVYGGYGMSETCTVLTLSGLMPKMKRRGFERQVEMRCKGGRPLPLAQIRIVDSEMSDLPHDGKTSGELVARAPWLTHGYFEGPEEFREALGRRLVAHGRLCDDRRRWIRQDPDRLKDVIKSGGEWISSLQLEDLILRHPGMAEAAVIGVLDPNGLSGPWRCWLPSPDRRSARHNRPKAARGCAAIRALVKRAIKSGGIRKDLDPIDLLRALVGVANVATAPGWQQSARRLVNILIAGARPLK